MNRFAHKHVVQLRECAAWPKHAQQSRKHARRRKNSIVTETVCRNYSFPSFFMFSLCWLYTPPFPQSLSFTLTLFLLHIPLHFAYLWLSPFHYTSPLLNTTCPPPQFSLFVFLFRHLIPALPSLPDIVARCPMSHTSAKIIRDGGRGEGAKERNRQGERKSRREWQREKYRK